MAMDRFRFKREAEEELKKRGMSKTELAKEIGSSTKSVQNTLWMPIDHLTPTVRKIAKTLELDISYLPKGQRNKKTSTESIQVTEKVREDGTIIRTTKTPVSEITELIHPEELNTEKEEESMVDNSDSFLKLNEDKALYIDGERYNEKKIRELVQRAAKHDAVIQEYDRKIIVMKKEYDILKDQNEALANRVKELLEDLKKQDAQLFDLSDKIMDLSIGSALKLKEALEGVLK